MPTWGVPCLGNGVSEPACQRLVGPADGQQTSQLTQTFSCRRHAVCGAAALITARRRDLGKADVQRMKNTATTRKITSNQSVQTQTLCTFPLVFCFCRSNTWICYILFMKQVFFLTLFNPPFSSLKARVTILLFHLIFMSTSSKHKPQVENFLKRLFTKSSMTTSKVHPNPLYFLVLILFWCCSSDIHRYRCHNSFFLNIISNIIVITSLFCSWITVKRVKY